jgi:ATP-dependent RNA helicase SUPV3L1/SUV3
MRDDECNVRLAGAAPMSAEAALEAFRAMDRETMPAVLDALRTGCLPQAAASAIGAASAVAEMVCLPQDQALVGANRAARARRGLLVWRRLADVLDGRIPETAIADGLQDGERQALLALMDAAVMGVSFHALRFPLRRGEAARVSHLSRLVAANRNVDWVSRAEKDAAAALFLHLETHHGIPRSVCASTVRSLASVACGGLDDAGLAALVAPRLPGLLDGLALRNGLAALAEHAQRTRLRYFEADLGDPEAAALLRAGAVGDAAARLAELRGERARRMMEDGLGTDDITAITARARGGDGQPAEIVKALMPVMGATFPAAAKAVAAAFGAARSDAAAFAEAAAAGARAERQRKSGEKLRLRQWEASLIDVPGLQAALGATPTEVRRWLDEGRIPVAKRVEFSKWNQTLTTTRHDPVEIRKLKQHLAGWRASHAEAVSARRREASRLAAAARRRTAAPASPQAILKRRLTGLLRSAGIPGVPAATFPEAAAAVPLLPVLGGWQASLLVPVPAGLTDLLQGESPLPAGPQRREAVDRLRGCMEEAKASAEARLAVVVAAWNERVDATAASFPSGGGGAFSARLEREVSAALGDDPGTGATADELAERLSRHLERSLVAAVNAHAREWGVEDLRVRSGLSDYAAMFPAARAKKRRLLLHLGPTNSGKTHAAMDRLAAAGSGVYLAPLRLMALEGAERMNGERGVPTDMITGEEIMRVEGARHVSATIEMADLATPVGVAIIDEIQMIADRDRGWAWSQAVVGVPADEVIMTGSFDALPYVTRIARMTGDELEVVTFERLTPLVALSTPVGLGAVREGDALVAFSRGEVLRLRDEISSRGIPVATIYGALGPEVRRAQAARFRSGEAHVLVATDAIAMGLNLPIQRVLLTALDKFDGEKVRALTASEIRQIAGRAGRFGISGRGEAGVTAGLSPATVASALDAVPRQPRDDRVPVMPPWPAVEAVAETLMTDDLGKILTHIAETLLKGAADLRAPALDDALAVAGAVARSGLPLRQRFRYLGCPVEVRDGRALAMVGTWARLHGGGAHIGPPQCMVTVVPDTDSGLAECERGVKLLSAYLWLALRWPSLYNGHDSATRERERLNGLIDGALRRRSLGRSCRRCGCRLPRSHRFPICDDCFHGNRHDDF